MLSLEKTYVMKPTYGDIKTGLLQQLDDKKITIPPMKSYDIKPYPIKKTLYQKPFTSAPFKQEHINDDFGESKLDHGVIKSDEKIDLEKNILKPLLGVPDKQIPDVENPYYYQMKLKGKTDLDVALDNWQQDETPMGQLIENETTGESLETIKANNKFKDVFDDIIKSRVGKNEITKKEGDKIIKENEERREIQKERKRGLKLKPVIPEVIPISEDDEASSKATSEAIEEENRKHAIFKDIEKTGKNNLSKKLREGKIKFDDLVEYLEETLEETKKASVMSSLTKPIYNQVITANPSLRYILERGGTVKAKTSAINKTLNDPDILKIVTPMKTRRGGRL